MSDYFDYTIGRLTPGTTARASDVNNTFDNLSVGLDKLPDEDDIKRGLINYVTAGGTANAITVTLPYAPTALVDGMEIVLKVSSTNTGATTINPNGLGVTDIRRRDGSVLQAGDLSVGTIAPMRYNATSSFFEITGSMTEGTGTMASQNSTAVSISGGTIENVTLENSTINNATLTGDIDGLGSLAIQSASSVVISGGTIDNVTMTGGTVGTHITDTASNFSSINTKADNHIAATAVHSATSIATPSRIVSRDSAGRAKVVAPSASDDIALKSTVDTTVSTHNTATTPHSGTLEPAFTKNSAFNKNFGTTSGTVAQGNDSRFLPAYGAVGSYVFAIVYGVGAGYAIDPGDTHGGWYIRPTGVGVGSNGTATVNKEWGFSNFSGTWRAHGYCMGGSSGQSATLFQRIA